MIGYQLPDRPNGVTHYAVEESARTADQQEALLNAALGMIGAWRDLDWQEMIEELDRYRHEVDPTPPIEL